MPLGNRDELPTLVYTVHETAAILKVTEKTIYRLVDRELLKASNALRHLRITRKSLEEFLAKTSGEVGHE
ncbi:helix-turn-helix domain-containing protein [Fontisphaera persica]|uniref:helix-turn-helix domain-containing protein n=1 Tax=Fontisphaera persica TaxID=2974023 RepID=UPI0024C0C12B|nr:helix-turn-helix domain-containing protein [Fontisphaera persica]WCJ60690.1 helix-turn-helix domain-containing protein [Fontisphaera persica]